MFIKDDSSKELLIKGLPKGVEGRMNLEIQSGLKFISSIGVLQTHREINSWPPLNSEFPSQYS